MIASTVYVGPNAAVCEYAMLFGAAEIRDNARVYGATRVGDGTIVSGNAEVFGNSTLASTPPATITITENAKVFGNARVLNASTVRGSALVSENARISENAIIEGTAKIFGNATVFGNALIQGNSQIHGRAGIGGDVVAVTPANVCEGRYFVSGTTLNSTICTNPPTRLLTTIQIASGYRHTCSLLTTGRVRCWGSNSLGQLGLGHTNTVGDDELPSSSVFVSTGGIAVQVVSGDNFSCALLNDGNVRCWGDNSMGQLGNGYSQVVGDNELPSTTPISSIGGVVTQLSAGKFHICALLNTNKVRCWGRNEYGQLGYGNTLSGAMPYISGDVNVGGDVVQISAGESHTCALLVGGVVRCWGRNEYGQLGYGNTLQIGDNEAPASAGNVNVGGVVTQISVGATHTCALLDTGAVRCWGLNSYGQLGYGINIVIGDNESPSVAGDVNIGGIVTQISSRASHNCALLNSGDLRCWGNNGVGQLGYGNTVTIGDNELPMSAGNVNTGGVVTQLSLGESHTCGLFTNGRLKCWGNNGNSQLGYPGLNNIGDNELPSSVDEVYNLVSKKISRDQKDQINYKVGVFNEI